jgi:hypothetical protein
VGVYEGKNNVIGGTMKLLYLVSKFQTTNLKLCVLGIVHAKFFVALSDV